MAFLFDIILKNNYRYIFYPKNRFITFKESKTSVWQYSLELWIKQAVRFQGSIISAVDVDC